MDNREYIESMQDYIQDLWVIQNETIKIGSKKLKLKKYIDLIIADEDSPFSNIEEVKDRLYNMLEDVELKGASGEDMFFEAIDYYAPDCYIEQAIECWLRQRILSLIHLRRKSIGDRKINFTFDIIFMTLNLLLRRSFLTPLGYENMAFNSKEKIKQYD